ncbi:MAG: hypothetical protein K2J20_04830, partial [Bacilli bacterium]|nr:hypothetical protein [Bacilli bacterium]
YKKIFEYLNIPMDVYKDSDLFLESDILIIKNIINLILLIYKKDYSVSMRYSFVSVARSFVGNYSDSEIFEFLSGNTFYESSIYKKCQDLAKELEKKTPSSLLNEILDKFSFYENLIKVGNVDSAMVRLLYIQDLTIAMENLGYTVSDFKEYLDSMVENKKEIRYKEARGIGTCVKIMNIHQSKGLEFPICYFAGFKEKFNVSDLKQRFMYDSKYGILTPFYKDGIGTTFLKTLIKNKYYQEEIAEKIRLFYVALTRAKERMIIVVPTFKEEKKLKDSVDGLTAIKFRSFYDFMNVISLNLSNYMEMIDITKLGLTKDYEFSSNKSYENEKSNMKMEFYEYQNDSIKLENRHASKVINEIISESEAKTMEYGTHMHEMLELTNFKDKNNKNKYIDNLRNTFEIEDATVYQELEFYFDSEGIEYHGIIDLMLEYEDEIKIIDYKLKNIDDENYVKQLKV